MIEHLVCSGSGPNGIVQLGVLVEYERQGLLCFKNLKKVYGCSAGSMICLMLALNIPLTVTSEYICKRPWNKFVQLDFFDMNEKGGIIDCEKIKEMCIPLLNAYDIATDITIKEVHDKYGIDIHIFSTDISRLEQVDFNSQTFPNMPALTAVMLSSAVPPIFRIGIYEGVAYIDGGFSDNFPLSVLLNDESKPDPATILCINIVGPLPVFEAGSSLFTLLIYILTKISFKMAKFELNHEMAQKLCKHYVKPTCLSLWSKELWEHFLYSQVEREVLFNHGIKSGKLHIKNVTESVTESVTEKPTSGHEDELD